MQIHFSLFQVSIREFGENQFGEAELKQIPELEKVKYTEIYIESGNEKEEENENSQRSVKRKLFFLTSCQIRY